MPRYPLFLNLEGERCLVFGGGQVAFRKIQALLKRGAKVTCVSRDFCGPLRRLSLSAKKRGGLAMTREGPLRNDDLNGVRLVIAATSDRAFNAHIAQACREKNILVNVVDDPKLCDFYVPAVVEKGPLQIAISTDGASPLFAKRLREELEKVIPDSVGRMLKRMGELRTRRPRGVAPSL